MLLNNTLAHSKELALRKQLLADADKQQQQLIRQYRLIESKILQKKCDELINELKLIEFKSCLLINADFANAYSLANQNVILTRGLLINIRNDDQLAHILAHEHAHLVLNHHQLAQELVNNPPKFFTKSRIKKFYRNIEIQADKYADKLLNQFNRDSIQIHHYLKGIQKTHKGQSNDHIKINERIRLTALPPEKLDKFWFDKGAF